MEAIRIGFEFEGTPIIGEVTHLDRWNMLVRIIEPYSEVSTYSPNIPYFQPRPKSFIDRDGVLTEYGEGKAWCMLEVIYRGCRVFDSERESLCKIYRGIIVKRNEAGHVSDEEYHSMRRLCRSRFRQEELPKKEYARRLREIRKENRRFHDVEMEALDALVARVVREHQLFLDRDLCWELVAKFL